MKRVAVICPGRGSYTEATLGSLPSGHPWVQRAESLRAEFGLEPLLSLDGAERFRSALHLKPSNVSPLIWLISMLDSARALEQDRCVCVAGNSMGWYTALAVGGALDFDDGFRLVQTMSLLQEEAAPQLRGGQIVYPIVGDDWRADPERYASVVRALETSGGEAAESIRLGGYAVLAGSDAGMAHLLASLPALEVGRARYPLRLAQHGPYHTPWVEPVAERARERLGDLNWMRPHTTLVDGRGVCFSPTSTDVDELQRVTLGHQVVAAYDFTRSVQVVLREYAPAELVLPGPGNTLGGVCGQVLVAERWRGITDRAAFDSLQAGSDPIVRSMGRRPVAR